MFYRTMWGGFGGRPIDPNMVWSAYFNGLLSVDLENMPEDAEPDPHVGMRPSLSPAPSPAKGPLSSSEGPMANGAPEDRPPRMNGAPEEEKIQEYLQRTDTAVIFPEPVGGSSPKKTEEKAPPTPEPAPVIEEPKVPNDYLLKCPHCDQVFSGQQAINELKDHLASSHKEASPPDAFVCQKCNASFTCKENLAKHKLFHATNGQTSTVSTDENAVLRKFKCTECGKAFKFKHHLKEHIRIHSGEKPFACGNCGKRFSHSGSYSSHMTSKKCLVVNLKVRKVDSRSPRGRGTTQNNSFRPIIPKYSSPGGNGAAPRTPEMPLLPAGYMPSSERFSNFSGRPQQPYLPLAFHPLISQPHYHLPMGAFSEVSHLLQQRSRFENDAPPGAEHHSHSQIPPHMAPTSSLQDRRDEAGAGSPQPPGEMKAVKKILEIVDRTVSKQQQSPTSQRSSNGLLSELLSSGPHPMIKTPPPQYSAPVNTRCRFCCKPFDSKAELYQHERFVCPHNTELRTKSEFSERVHENGSDIESAEEMVNRVSPSSLSVECILTLKAHYSVNPRPKKSELIRLSRDLKCSTRTVQDWFHSQQIKSKDFSINGEITHSSSPLQQTSGFTFPSVIPPSNGHPFQSAVIPYNGTLSSSSHIVPFRPIPERSPLLDAVHREEDQPLDLSIKMKSDESKIHVENSSNHRSSPVHFESGALNLSQRSSRTPPKVSSPYSLQNNRGNNLQLEDSAREHSQNHIQSSLLYKYMQMGISNRRHSPQREKSPTVTMPSSPERSPARAEQQPQNMPSPDHISYADHSSSPSGTTGSYGHTDETAEGNPFSPNAKKMRLWNQGEGDESTLEDSPCAEDSSEGSGKTRKSWKMHKMENEEGMYVCDQCDKMFSKQSSLARHKYEHSGQRPHKCDICGKAFKHKHHLTEHKRLHSGEKPFQCKKCLKRFSHSGSYSQHMNHRFSYCKPYHE